MKFFALCVVVLVAGAFAGELTKEQQARLNEAVNSCIQKTGVSQDVVNEMSVGVWTHVDDTAKCYSKCALEAIHLLKNSRPDKNVIKDTLYPLFGQPKVDSAITACDSVVGTNDCDTAFKLYQCYIKILLT